MVVFSHKNFLSGVRPEWMVKLKNKKRLEWCLKRYANGGASQKDLAKMLDVTHAFEAFLKGHNIKPILCRYKHPQSNGKIERWWGIYKTHRKRFNTFQEFIAWYNNRPHGSLNLRRAETPEQAFWRRLPEEYYYALAAKFLR